MMMMFINNVTAIAAPSFTYPDELIKFIKKGKMVNSIINKNTNTVILFPKEEVQIKDVIRNKTLKLTPEELYFLKTEKKDINHYHLQVFASKERDKAWQVRKDLFEKGFINVFIAKEEDWYKVRIGNYLSREDVVKKKSELKEEGWDSWLLSSTEKDEIQLIIVYNIQGKEVFSGNYLEVKGKLLIDGYNNPGLNKFVLNDLNKIDIYNQTELENYLTGLMENITMNSEVSLQEIAIFIRTYILYYIINDKDDLLEFNLYKGINSKNSKYSKAVSDTTGQIQIRKDGKLPDFDFDLDSRINKIGQNLNRNDTNSFLYGLELIDLTKTVKEEIKVDAEIKWGLNYKEINQLTWWGPRKITVLDLDLSKTGFYVKPVLANDAISGLADLTDMVIKNKVLAGINGGYFSYTGRPLGLIVQDGQIISEPVKNRSALLISEDDKVSFSRVSWQGELYQNNTGQINTVTGVNRPPGNDEIVIFNKHYGTLAPALKEGIKEISVINNKVVDVRENKGDGLIINSEGYIIQAHGWALEELHNIKIGDIIYLRNNFKFQNSNVKIKHALSGGPTLIKDGVISINSKEEQFQPDIAYGRAPRTTVGVTDDNHLLLFTVDGRQPGFSIGISLEEMALFMIKRGIINGINLDGGGSARMVVRGYTMNNPSDDRLISNGLIIGYDIDRNQNENQ